MTLYSKNNCSISTKYKGDMECYYSKKIDHTTWNYIFHFNDILKGKYKYKPHVANVVVIEDPPYANSGDELTEERAFYMF